MYNSLKARSKFLKFPCVFANQAYKGLDNHKISLSGRNTASELAREIRHIRYTPLVF